MPQKAGVKVSKSHRAVDPVSGKCAKEHTIGSVFLLHVQFTETKITQRDMTSVIQQDIFRFQVPVNHTEPV